MARFPLFFFPRGELLSCPWTPEMLLLLGPLENCPIEMERFQRRPPLLTLNSRRPPRPGPP